MSLLVTWTVSATNSMRIRPELCGDSTCDAPSTREPTCDWPRTATYDSTASNDGRRTHPNQVERGTHRFSQALESAIRSYPKTTVRSPRHPCQGRHIFSTSLQRKTLSCRFDRPNTPLRPRVGPIDHCILFYRVHSAYTFTTFILEENKPFACFSLLEQPETWRDGVRGCSPVAKPLHLS
jgi:hypothetical protein